MLESTLQSYATVILYSHTIHTMQCFAVLSVALRGCRPFAPSRHLHKVGAVSALPAIAIVPLARMNGCTCL